MSQRHVHATIGARLTYHAAQRTANLLHGDEDLLDASEHYAIRYVSTRIHTRAQ